MTPQDLALKYGRAQLGIDGNCGFALLGVDLQEGEAEFSEVREPGGVDSQLSASKRALCQLRERLGMPDLGYYFGPSHPFGG